MTKTLLSPLRDDLPGVNVRYRIINNNPGYGRKRINRNSIATLLAEYDYFYLFQGHAYKFTVSKNDIKSGFYTMEKIGEDAK